MEALERAHEEESRETRCYAVTGAARALDCLEALLRRVEWIGERKATRLVSAFVDGRGMGELIVRALGSWIAETNEAEGGSPLPRLEDEETPCAHFVVGIPG